MARHRLELHEGIRLFALTDPSRLRQILEHLVENAVKYAPPETTITLDWRMADGAVRIGVADEGPGIPEEWRERIFEPYARRETRTARGSGIGLIRGPAARRNPWAPGCGASRPTATAPGSSSRCGRGGGGRLMARALRILVVDDDPAMVGAITALVGTEGHQVITAYDGLTAVRRYREERPDIVLLDLAMPGPDGFTVAGRIRAEGDAPIVVVSGESSEEAKVRALGIGADDYLVKPFGRAELLARIAAVMRRADRVAGPAPACGRGRRNVDAFPRAV